MPCGASGNRARGLIADDVRPSDGSAHHSMILGLAEELYEETMAGILAVPEDALAEVHGAAATM